MTTTPASQADNGRVTAALVNITLAIGAGRDLGRVFETVADEVAALLPYDRCSVALLDAERQTLRITSVRSALPSPIDDGEHPVATTAGGWVVSHRRPLIHDVGPEDRFAGDAERRRAGVKQFVVVPIVVDDAAVGAFGLSSTEPGVYRADDLWLLETVADHLGVAIAATNLRHHAEQRANRAQVLAELAAAFATATNLDTALRQAATRTAEILGDLNAILLRDERSGDLRLAHLAPGDPATGVVERDAFAAAAAQLGGGPWHQALAGDPILVPTVPSDAVPGLPWSRLPGGRVASWLAVPLRTGGEVIGLLVSARIRRPPLARDRPTPGDAAPFGPDDLVCAQDLAAQIAGAILNARLLAATRRALDESEALRRIGRELTATVDLDRVLTLVSTFARLLLGADYAAAAVDEDGSYAWHGMVGNRTDAHTRVRIPSDQGVLGRTIAARRPIVIEGFPDNPEFPPEDFPVQSAEGMRSALAVPFRAGERVFGALLLGYRSHRNFDADDERLAVALADQGAIVLENARLFAEARRAIALREEFLSIAAHELRTPLTILKGRIQLLDRRLAPLVAPRDIETVRVARRQIDRLERLVADLLDASMIDAGRLPHAPEPVDLVALVHRVVADAVPVEDERPIAVSAAGPELIAVVDPWGIEQVLTNLLANARRYSPPGTALTIRVDRDGADARVEVEDAGMGIAAEDLERIFERFYRVDDPRAGIGLGLSISRRIVTDHGGRLWATSPGLDQGATFVMTLPLSPPDRAGGTA